MFEPQPEHLSTLETAIKARSVRQELRYERAGVTQFTPLTDDLDSLGIEVRNFSPDTPKVYPWTTENVVGYYQKLADILHFDEKSRPWIACISGSSDFAVTAAGEWGAFVDTIDIVKYASAYGELKRAMLETASYDDYLKFFPFYESPYKSTFAYDPYQQSRKMMSQPAIHFWDQLIKPDAVHSKLRIPQGFFITKVLKQDILKRMNPFLADRNTYERYQKRRPLYVFQYPHEIRKFWQSGESIDGGYHLIHLSNILAYVKTVQEQEDIFEQSIDHLRPGGALFAYYFVNRDTSTGKLKYYHQSDQGYFKDQKGLETIVVEGNCYHSTTQPKFTGLVIKKK